MKVSTSSTRQMAALRRIHELVKEGSQFVIATHSPILMAYPDAQILLIDENEIRTVAYTDTEHFAVVKSFLNNHQKMIAELLSE
jgi:predicted ATPase